MSKRCTYEHLAERRGAEELCAGTVKRVLIRPLFWWGYHLSLCEYHARGVGRAGRTMYRA